ncbi:MAG: hypothetical protein M0R46_01485 [Candidatus Muirbacterium halophilum]|nr:hypothetical protein [Candidatus Muirbacterium halophilum]MCK9474567.1 hypothetical protein [Candidatus Muirbacterium halophilum]
MFKYIFIVFLISGLLIFVVKKDNNSNNLIEDKSAFIESEFNYLNNKKFVFRDENQKKYIEAIDDAIKQSISLFEKGYYNSQETDFSKKLDKAELLLDNLLKESFSKNDAKLRYFLGRLFYVKGDRKNSRQMLMESFELKDNDFFPWNREWAEKSNKALNN